MMMRSSTAALALALVFTSVALATDWVKHYADRVAAFKAENEKLDRSKKHVTLVGDSLTENFSRPKMKKFLPTVGERTLNRGISSDGLGVRARGVERRLDESVFDTNPSHVFLYCGVNDLWNDAAVEPAAKVYRRIVEAIRKKAPSAVLVLVTCTPTNKTYKDRNGPIVKFNEHVRALAKELKLDLIDLHALFVGPDGMLPLDMASDGLHFGDKGYEIYGREIEKICGRERVAPGIVNAVPE